MEPPATRSAGRVCDRRCLPVLAMRHLSKQFKRIAAVCYKGQHIIGAIMRKLVEICSGRVCGLGAGCEGAERICSCGVVAGPEA